MSYFMDLKRLGKEIVALRALKSKSQEDVWRGAKIARNAIQRLEAGESNPTVSTLEAVAKELGQELVLYISGTDEAALLDTFASLSPRDRDQVLGFARGLAANHNTQAPTGLKR